MFLQLDSELSECADAQADFSLQCFTFSHALAPYGKIDFQTSSL